jgi:hypothetical protein
VPPPPPTPARRWRGRTWFWSGFATAYAAAAALFALYLGATNPKATMWEALREGVAWPATMIRDILDSGWLHASPALGEHCRGKPDCDVS